MDFQTKPAIAKYMASMVPTGVVSILEPTPGMGNIVEALTGYQVTAPADYFLIDRTSWFDCIVMNPPFSAPSANLENAPAAFQKKGMKIGYCFLFECMQRSNHIIALMPWFTLIDSDVRTRDLKRFGLKSITALPRSAFDYARIQCLILEMERGYAGPTEYKVYDLLQSVPSELELTQLKIEL